MITLSANDLGILSQAPAHGQLLDDRETLATRDPTSDF